MVKAAHSLIFLSLYLSLTHTGHLITPVHEGSGDLLIVLESSIVDKTSPSSKDADIPVPGVPGNQTNLPLSIQSRGPEGGDLILRQFNARNIPTFIYLETVDSWMWDPSVNIS